MQNQARNTTFFEQSDLELVSIVTVKVFIYLKDAYDAANVKEFV